MNVMLQKGSTLPKGAWDSHIHVIDRDKFQMKDERPFTPKQATLDQALEYEKSLGIGHVCIIASSIYGTDNSCLVDALERLKGKGRGIAYINAETITDAELDELHSVGVRGVRLNLWTRSLTMQPEQWKQVLTQYANRLKRLNWVLQVYASMNQIETIADIVPKLGVKVVFDHLGCPNPGAKAEDQPGGKELYNLLSQNKNVYIKISGAYRFEASPDLDGHIRKLLEIAPNQVVWASDWPHTGGMKNNPGGDPHQEQEFLKPDIPAFLAKCVELCQGDELLIQQLWVTNPRRLWDYIDVD